jgi:hypothetical protein
MKINKIIVLLFLLSANQIIAQTYFGYQKQPPATDWSQVSRDLNGSINDVNRERENRKAELDRITASNINSVSLLNAKSNKSIVNYLCLSFQQATIIELQNYNSLLKQGLLDPSQFNTINFNCALQYNLAVNYCNQLDARLSLMDENSDKYMAVQKAITDYVNNSNIKFNTNYRETRNYLMVMSQLYSITAKGTEQMGMDWFFSNLKGLIAQ